jgi:hypothetical protein
MMQEFNLEISGHNPYLGERLSASGRAAFPDLMRAAIQNGSEVTLISSLMRPVYWVGSETYIRDGVPRSRRINSQQAAESLGLNEFNTWYVRGLSKKLLDLGETQCQVYRAAQPKWTKADCSAHENRFFPLIDIYNGHRAKYWPTQNPSAFSIPSNPSCHHTIKRI